MKDIIIVGIGKAGKLHLQSYNKIKEKGKIYLVDNQKQSETEEIYKTIVEAIKENKLDVQNTIIDICTPSSVFNKIINECTSLGIKNILVEKPFTADNNFFTENKGIKIVMIQNYLYSAITEDIKKYLNEKHLKIKSIYTNFSKNKIITEKDIRNLEIEMPHQIYIANYLIGNYKNQTTIEVKERNVEYSKIICKKDDIHITHESDLIAKEPKREIIIDCENNIVIKGEYLIYGKKIKQGKIQVLEKGREIWQKVYEKDDNIYECILDAYRYFNKNSITKKYENRILEFGKEFREYINM